MTTVGVPLIAPVDESRERPVGRDGETDQDVIVPPLVVGVKVVIGVFRVSVNEVELYVMVGITSLTTMVTLAVSVPPVLVAVIV